MLKDDFFKDIDYNRLPAKAGRLLISEPFLHDSFFSRTVVVLVEHHEEGSVGFIINKPIEVQIEELVEGFPAVGSDIHFGGPVAEDNLFYLHTVGNSIEGALQVMPGLWWGGSFDDVRTLADTGQLSPDSVRFFVGYSGWAKDQLKDELEQNAWIVAETTARQVMQGKTEDFWNQKLKTMGKKFAAIANFPEDPSLN